MGRPRTPKMTPSDIAALPARIAAGESVASIARSHHVGENTIRHHLGKNGGKLRKIAVEAQAVDREELMNTTLGLIRDAVDTMREAVDQAKVTGKQAVIIRLGTREATQVLRALESRPVIDARQVHIDGQANVAAAAEMARDLLDRLEKALTPEEYEKALKAVRG